MSAFTVASCHYLEGDGLIMVMYYVSQQFLKQCAMPTPVLGDVNVEMNNEV